MDEDKRKKEAKLAMMEVIREKARSLEHNWTVLYAEGSEFEKMLEESIKKKFNAYKK